MCFKGQALGGEACWHPPVHETIEANPVAEVKLGWSSRCGAGRQSMDLLEPAWRPNARHWQCDE